MKTELAINLCWNNDQENILKTYKVWLDKCYDNNICLIRLFCCKWSIDSLYNKKYIKELVGVIAYAKTKNIKISLVLLNFVDFNKNNYLDINNENYTWQKNKYNKNSKVSTFFNKLDNDFISDVEYLLQQVCNFDNLEYIEIMNELDQIRCNRKILAKWCNELISKLKKDGFNYNYVCSISNSEQYNYYKFHLNCHVDLHFYSFPYSSAIKNVKYIKNQSTDILYLGEYAKYSDSHYLEDLSSKIYFASGLWGAFILGMEYTPLHWWWKELLDNLEYIKIMNNFNELSKMIEIKSYEFLESKNINYKYIESSLNREKSKIKDRLLNLVYHPSYIFKEYRSVKKLINKKLFRKEEPIIIKIISTNKEFYYIETNNNTNLELDFINSQNFGDYVLINLITGQERIINIKINEKLILNGCYFLEKQDK